MAFRDRRGAGAQRLQRERGVRTRRRHDVHDIGFDFIEQGGGVFYDARVRRKQRAQRLFVGRRICNADYFRSRDRGDCLQMLNSHFAGADQAHAQSR